MTDPVPDDMDIDSDPIPRCMFMLMLAIGCRPGPGGAIVLPAEPGRIGPPVGTSAVDGLMAGPKAGLEFVEC